MEKSFVQMWLDGMAEVEDIDFFVDRWHNLPENSTSLSEYLGFTEDEYKIWIESPSELINLLPERSFSRLGI